MVAEDFTVTFTNSTFNITKYARVVSITSNVLLVKFGGAPSGIYIPNIQHTVYGRLDNGDFILTTEGYVTSITPTTSSIFGGTLITI
jgi:hypothetical protein